MLSFHQRLFRQNSLNQHSPKFFPTKVSSFTVRLDANQGSIIDVISEALNQM